MYATRTRTCRPRGGAIDTDTFDRIVRLFARDGSRRTVLATLLGSTLTAADDVTARKRRRRKRHKKRSGCAPDCTGKDCGGDGCGGSCGICTQPETCVGGTCQCVPDCDGTHCGADGCGGTCACPASAFCSQGSCVPCEPPCPSGQRCVHGTCSCDPFANTCPTEQDGQCGCGAIVRLDPDEFLAACVDRNSACDLDKPCDTNEDCPTGSVCLLGCREPTDPQGPRRCSTPCVPV